MQPEVGKLLIAVGEWLFGLNSFGWRFASAVFGSLAILLMCRIARRMTRSTLLGCVAGLLMSLDGLEFVASRTGILDIFLMFFVLAAFGCMVIDRDISRARLATGRGYRRTGGRGAGDPRARALARDPAVAGRGRDLPGAGRGDQVERGLVHPRVRRARHLVGHRRPPDGRAALVRCGARSATRCGCRSPSS